MGAKDTAVGPGLGDFQASTNCSIQRMFAEGQFPLSWKTVLAKKPGRPVDSSYAYRAIVLLDKLGKLFGRIISTRLVAYLMGREGPDLADGQFSFRRDLTIWTVSRAKG